MLTEKPHSIPVISPIDVPIRELPALRPAEQPARIPGPPENLDGPAKAVMYQNENWWRDKLERSRKRLRGETDPTER